VPARVLPLPGAWSKGRVRLLKYLERPKQTHAAAAKLAGVSASEISMLASGGRRRPSLEVAFALRVLGVEPEEWLVDADTHDREVEAP
jgi:hypothetical protein